MRVDTRRMYEYNAQLVRVVDGDTVDISVDLGFHISQQIRVRLNGINSPETSTPAGKGAKSFWRDCCRSAPHCVATPSRTRPRSTAATSPT